MLGHVERFILIIQRILHYHYIYLNNVTHILKMKWFISKAQEYFLSCKFYNNSAKQGNTLIYDEKDVYS
jgi:hypothetical protein